jgi:hypothetical protein
MSKELNLIEAMKMPVGTEFEVKYSDSSIATENIIIKEEDSTPYLVWSNNEDVRVFYDLLDSKFIHIEKPVSFMEVVNSGKRCKVKHPDMPEEYMGLDDMLYCLGGGYDSEECAKIIKEGKWYLEE